MFTVARSTFQVFGRDGKVSCHGRHVFRKTAATELDQAALSARQIADQLGHAKVSMTQDRDLGRRAVDDQAAEALDRAYRNADNRADREFPPVSAG